MSPDLSLYIHVPFCRRRCAYCHFDIKVFHPRTEPQRFYQDYLDLVGQELQHLARLHPDRPLRSVFYGGGTPSRLGSDHLETLHRQVLAHFTLVKGAEVSMEVNPEDAEPSLIHRLRQLGITRLSLGVQTFEDKILKTIGRVHNAARAEEAANSARGFVHGLSLDLILGLPGQDEAGLSRDLARIVQINPEHVALYMLEQDLPTPLDKIVTSSQVPDEDRQADFYLHTADFLEARGYHHYEISNFSKRGYACVHNRNYWLLGDYLGVGPAAHGRVGRRYYMNHGQLKDYGMAVRATGRGLQQEQVWDEQRFTQERLIQGLRLDEGLPESAFSSQALARLKPVFDHGLLLRREGNLSLSRKGRLLANEVFTLLL